MLDPKLIIALLISITLAVLLFRSNYTMNIKASRERYTERDKFNYGYLIMDTISSITFAAIGCYLAWDSITTIQGLKEYDSYKFLWSILNGILFQQILPIIIEIAMNKINALKSNNDLNGRG